MSKKSTRKSATARRGGTRRAPAAADRERAARVYDTLQATYPDATCALRHDNAWQLLVATILSAQCTDERVNMVTPALFERYPTPADLADANPTDVEELIRSTGFYRNKTKSIVGAARAVANEHEGRVPDEMEELLELPGVARKTANVVLGNAFNKSEGVVVDTHVKRLSYRLGFTKQTDPGKIEDDLRRLFPPERWTMLAHLLIFHGRRTCVARKPRCSECPVADDCPQKGVKQKA